MAIHMGVIQHYLAFPYNSKIELLTFALGIDLQLSLCQWVHLS